MWSLTLHAALLAAALTELTTGEVVDRYGEEALAAWRRSLDSKPPPYIEGGGYDPRDDRRYQRFEESQPSGEVSAKEGRRTGRVTHVPVPDSESFRDMIARCQPVWEEDIRAELEQGRSVLLVGHGNTLRAMVGAIEGLRDEELTNMEMPQCLPLVYCFEREAQGGLAPIRPERPSRVNGDRVLHGEFLASAADLEAAQAAALKSSMQRYGMVPRPAPVAPTDGGATEPTPSAPIVTVTDPPWRRQHVVIIRHGKTENNKLGLFTGWEDVGLAPEGRAEASEAGRMMARAGFTFDVVYTSWL